MPERLHVWRYAGRLACPCACGPGARAESRLHAGLFECPRLCLRGCLPVCACAPCTCVPVRP
eukprot:6235258-Alexandrium_andersonii.AAC.1